MAPARHKLSRRQLINGIAALGFGSAGLGATGCQVQTSSTGSDSTDFEAIRIPDPVGKFPEGNVEIRWMSGGPGAKSEVFKALFPAYEKKHSNVTVTYDELPNAKISEVLPLQLRNNNAADVFNIVDVPLSELVNTGKVAALDDIVPDFDAWVSAMPDGVMLPGVNMFNGKVYAYRASIERRLRQMLLFNTELMHQAGYDPVDDPFTLDRFREVAKKITKAGDGDVYGVMSASTFDPAEHVTLNGGPPPMDWKTGTYQYVDDMYVEIMEFFKAMVDDGSFFPGFGSLDGQEARAQFPLGRAGMMLNGPWNFSVWAHNFPDFTYGVAPAPAPADHGFYYGSPEGGVLYSVFANAPDDHLQVAGDLIRFLGSEEGQKTWARLDGSGDPAWSPDALAEVRKSGALSEQDYTAFDLYDEYVRMAPSPLVGNPETEQVRLAQKPVKPNLSDIFEGFLSGQIDDLRTELRKLNDASEKNLDHAIAKATSQGAKVSRNDWVFNNWDPTKDYTTDDYANR